MTGVWTLLVALTAASGPGSTLQARFDDGARHYWAGRYQESYDAWRGLVAYGIDDADLYYDLGNVSFQLGRRGEALAWYEKARRLSPHDDDLQANLAAAEEALAAVKVVHVVEKGTAAGEGSFESWYRLFTGVSPSLLAWLVGLCNLLVFGGLIARRLLSVGLARRLVGWACLVAVVLGLAGGTLLVGNAWIEASVRVAVTVGRPTPVLDGPTREARVLFELPEGQLVRWVATQEGYAHARVNAALQGWVDGDHLLEVR